MNWVSKLKPEKFGKLLDFGFLVNATTAVNNSSGFSKGSLLKGVERERGKLYLIWLKIIFDMAKFLCVRFLLCHVSSI